MTKGTNYDNLKIDSCFSKHHRGIMQAESLENAKEAHELLELQPWATLTSRVLSKYSQIHHNSVKSWLKHVIIYLTVQSFSDENLWSLCLPTHLTNLLSTPTGHCFVCCSPYFTAAFLLEESAEMALRVVKPNSESLQRLRDVACSFVFCCCSRSCLDKVYILRDFLD